MRNSIDFFCLSPGSRSAPLAVAVAKNPKAKKIIFYDERAAAYAALGYSKATNRAAVCICTSGTAVVNYYPAIVEASKDNVPMIFLSADRPPELWSTGANQAIEQHHLFGNYLRWFFDFPVPNDTISPNFILTSVDQGIYKAHRQPSGPIQFNCPFAEPLSPVEKFFNSGEGLSFSRWKNHDRPYTQYSRDSYDSGQIVDKIAKNLNKAQNGLIILGRNKIKQKIYIKKLLGKLGWPVFTDINSGFRFEKLSSIPFFSEPLLLSEFIQNKAFDSILQLGGSCVSKRVLQLVQKNKPDSYILIDSSPERIDPEHLVSLKIEGDIEKICQQLYQKISRHSAVTDQQIYSLTNRIESTISKELERNQKLTEPVIAKLVSRVLSDNSGLCVGNSMPIRDMDFFAERTGKNILICTNRGASGIDGNIATAFGFANGLCLPTTAVVGDVALIHDLNSLFLLKKSNYPVFLVCINNNGSGIFSFLPISDYKDVFTDFFQTPHGLTFKKAAELFDLPYKNPKNKNDFLDFYKYHQQKRLSCFIEIHTNKEDNFMLHESIVKSICSDINMERNNSALL